MALKPITSKKFKGLLSNYSGDKVKLDYFSKFSDVILNKKNIETAKGFLKQKYNALSNPIKGLLLYKQSKGLGGATDVHGSTSYDGNQECLADDTNTLSGLGQTFKLPIDATISSIKLYIYRYGSPSGNIKIHIKDTSSDLPNSSLGDSGDYACSDLATTATITEFTLSATTTVSANTLYAITIEEGTSYSGDTDNKPILKEDTTGTAYSDGNEVKCNNAGTWSADTGADLYFQINYAAAGSTEKLIYVDNSSINTIPINPLATAFYSKSTNVQGVTGRSIARDNNGNLYILNSSTQYVAKYDSDGDLSSATFMNFSSATAIRGICADDSGYLYIVWSDGGTEKVTKYNASDGSGTGDSKNLNSQADYICWSEGNLYIENGTAIDYIDDALSGSLTTISGTASEDIKDMAVGQDGYIYAIYNNSDTTYGLKQVDTSGMTKIINDTGTNIDGSIAVDQYNRIFIVCSSGSGDTSMLVYNTDGTLLTSFAEQTASDNSDPFLTGSDAHILSAGNKLYIHDYLSGQFIGWKVFLI